MDECARLLHLFLDLPHRSLFKGRVHELRVALRRHMDVYKLIVGEENDGAEAPAALPHAVTVEARSQAEAAPTSSVTGAITRM